MQYHECGANLDSGERCDCTKKAAQDAVTSVSGHNEANGPEAQHHFTTEGRGKSNGGKL